MEKISEWTAEYKYGDSTQKYDMALLQHENGIQQVTSIPQGNEVRNAFGAYQKWGEPTLAAYALKASVEDDYKKDCNVSIHEYEDCRTGEIIKYVINGNKQYRISEYIKAGVEDDKPEELSEKHKIWNELCDMISEIEEVLAIEDLYDDDRDTLNNILIYKNKIRESREYKEKLYDIIESVALIGIDEHCNPSNKEECAHLITMLNYLDENSKYETIINFYSNVPRCSMHGEDYAIIEFTHKLMLHEHRDCYKCVLHFLNRFQLQY